MRDLTCFLNFVPERVVRWHSAHTRSYIVCLRSCIDNFNGSYFQRPYIHVYAPYTQPTPNQILFMPGRSNTYIAHTLSGDIHRFPSLLRELSSRSLPSPPCPPRHAAFTYCSRQFAGDIDFHFTQKMSYSTCFMGVSDRRRYFNY